MQKLYAFVYYPVFDRIALGLLTDADFMELEATLTGNPQVGDVVAHTNGARKLRVGVRGRGKSGGARVIYIFVEVAGTFHLLLCYPKNVQGNLNDAQKAQLRAIITAIREESRR